MNNQVKLIDADKLLVWLTKRMWDTAGSASGVYHAFEETREALESGKFYPDTPPVPTIKPGDKVRHKDRKMKYLGIGNVLDIAASGQRARVEWPNYDKAISMWEPYPSYYRLDKLEVVE